MKRLAPLVMALIAVIAIVLGWRREEEQRSLQQRALRLVTSSDVVPVRLEASAGVPPAAHGTYRAKAGIGLAVLTTSNLPPLEAGARYVAWVRQGERWVSLGAFELEPDGRSLLASENQALASPADEVRVTRESKIGGVPAGPTVLAWSNGR